MVAPRMLDLGHGGLDTTPRIIAVSAAATARFGDYVNATTSVGAYTVTLPSADRVGTVSVRNYAGTFTVTVDGAGSETIDGAANVALTMVGESVTLISDGSGHWFRVGGSFTSSQVLPVTSAVNTVAASGAAQTIPEPGTYGISDITLTAATVTLTFPAASQGKRLRMVFRQDGAGNRAVAWPAGSIFPGGTDVVITVTGSAIDYVEAFCVVEDVWMITRIGAAYAV